MQTKDGSNRRQLRVLGMGAALAAVLAFPGVAAGANGGHSGPTSVQDVKVFKVGDRVKVDVVVSHPDAKAKKLPRKARNHGSARITLRAPGGAVLATHTARAALPVSVPRAREVLQTYRFPLDDAGGARLSADGTVNVEVVAESRLVPGGSDDPATDRDTSTSDVPVADLDAEPALSRYVDIRFGTGTGCDVDDDDCGTYFDFRSLPGPFHDETGRVRIRPSGGRTTIWFGTSGNQFLEGSVSSMASDRYEITNGIVVPWGIGKITSAARDAGTPGKQGGPLSLDVEREFPGKHDWHVWGYVSIAVSGD